jgi:hypothetical protein
MSDSSAYERITANLDENGKLPRDFSLEPERAPNELSFMPGAMDGIGVFHAGRGDNPDEAVKKAIESLTEYFKSGGDESLVAIEAVLDEHRAISIIDPILDGIRSGSKEIEPGRILESSLNIIQSSDNIELIKIGIGVLGLFELGGFDNIAVILSNIGAYDDFTLYAVVAASNWTGGNDLVFNIAKRVDGWGKIHAVERLEPENDEIREWILRDGCANSVMDAYLGLECAVKGDLIAALRKETVDGKMFDSISIIIDALLDEGPVPGISEYEYAEEALSLYLHHASVHAQDVGQLWRVLNVRLWANDAKVEYKNDVLEKCDEIAERSDWQDKIFAAVRQPDDEHRFFCACNAASRMDIDISSELFAAVKEQPLKHCAYIPRLFKDADKARELIALCESILPLAEMAEGMGDYIFADKFGREHQCLDYILPELAAYPLSGANLIKTGLNSRVRRGRNMALRALAGWEHLLGKPLCEITPELCDEVRRISEIEVNEDIKRTMISLIDTEITAEEQ